VGAIRWDAWQSPGSPTNRAVERSLAPPAYRHRLPFFARIGPDGSVTIDGSAQAVMDREIALALRAGLGFWGFLGYPRESPMSAGLKLYLASPERHGLRFCMLSELVQWGTARDAAEPVVDWHLELMRHPDYQRAPDGRPLYFLGFLSDRLIAERWGDAGALRAAVDRFRARAVAEGAGNPYLVLMARPDPGVRIAQALGADALSAYAIAEADLAAPYAALAQLAERRWDAYAASGLGVVPTVMSGWDRRPRIQSPVPWESWQRPGVGMDRYYAEAQPQELAAHLRRALEWIALHPRVAVARAALIYAWNENDEGGWLVPTLPFDDRRVEALRAVLCTRGTGPEAGGPGCG
ncbi:MAG TPA: hypothetical protein VE684_07500, partial [Crenalkalicoccus sp.]|nr:hypothetical protein [Crenalkalicoccus sp.]